MSLRQQQAAVFCATVLVIFGLLGAGIWLIAQRLTTEATLQAALLMARQVEIALADSLRERSIVVQPRPAQKSSSFWDFLGNLLPGQGSSRTAGPQRYTPPRHTDVKGLMQAFLDRSASIEAMWVVNADGKLLYASLEGEENPADESILERLRRGEPIVHSRRDGGLERYDVWVPLQMPNGVRSPGGLRLWINPADWTGLVSGLWRQFVLLFGLGGIVALLSASLTTALYTRRFRLISDTLRQAETGTYAARPQYAGRDEVGASLDLIDRLVMRQRRSGAPPAPVQRLALAARTLAHEVKTPLNALAIHLEVLRAKLAAESEGGQTERSLSALDSSVRQVDRLVRDFTDYSAPVTMERKSLDAAEVLDASLEALGSMCAMKNIALSKEAAAPRPWPILGDASRLRQSFDNLLRNAIEAQPEGGEIAVSVEKTAEDLILDFADAGPGVAPDRRDQLFEFGKTTKLGGSGIGLPLSQLIVESHGGSLTYVDRNGARGAVFRVKLPLEVRQ